MRTLDIAEIRELYHDYLLEIHKDWNKPGTHTDSAKQRVSDTLYLWNHGNKEDFWRYISNDLNIEEAYIQIKELLKADGATSQRQQGYCSMLNEFKQYIDIRLGGISSIIDGENIVINEVSSIKEITPLRSIKASDNISFDYNYMALNACFAANMKGTYQQALWAPGDGCMVWFPHLAKMVDGKYVAGSTEVNWKNYFEDNGNIIVQMLYPGEMPQKNSNDEPTLDEDSIIPVHTFMKMGEHDFRYVGTYLRDYNCSTPRYAIFRLIKDKIDLSLWADGYDTNYFDTSEIGKDVFKGMYLERNYKKQQSYINDFLKNKAENEDVEKSFNNSIEQFVNKYSLGSLNGMSSAQFKGEYIPELCTSLNDLFNKQYTPEILANTLGDLHEYGQVLVDLLYDENKSIDNKIRSCAWGNIITAEILSIYGKNMHEILYTLDEITINKIISAVGIKLEESADLVVKQSRLYFWRFCDDTIREWSIFKYFQFLMYMAKAKQSNIEYISSAKPDIRNRIIAEEKRQEEELFSDSFEDVSSGFEYNSAPRPAEIIIDSKIAKNGSMVPRHADRKINALIKANFCCEIDKNHPTFIRRNSDKNYTETHHLIPLEFSAEFENTLDTEENIVSLCSNCHNQIHYGRGAEVLIKKLYEDRKEALKAAGISTTKKGIDVTLEQLLHMYGIDQ